MSQISKLGYVDSKLGAPSSGQQTTRILFNTIEAPGTTSSLSFFKTFQGLTQGQTNLTQNKLDSMESMVIKTIWLTQLLTSGAAATFGGQVQPWERGGSCRYGCADCRECCHSGTWAPTRAHQSPEGHRAE